MVREVPPNSVVVGVPGQVVVRSHPREEGSLPDLNHNTLPDTIGELLALLMEHVKELEERIDGDAKNVHVKDVYVAAPLHVPDHGIWHGEDFSI